jgi:hypothetical protein
MVAFVGFEEAVDSDGSAPALAERVGGILGVVGEEGKRARGCLLHAEMEALFERDGSFVQTVFGKESNVSIGLGKRRSKLRGFVRKSLFGLRANVLEGNQRSSGIPSRGERIAECFVAGGVKGNAGKGLLL